MLSSNKLKSAAPLPRIAVILAGGQSLRFGRDKLLEPVNGTPLIKILIQKLRDSHFNIFISGSKKKYRHLGYPVIEDETPYGGPLLALDSIWKKTKADKIFLIAGDMPFIQIRVIETLWRISENQNMTLLEGPKGPSPLPGVYSRQTHQKIKELILGGRRDLTSLWKTGFKLTVLGYKVFYYLDRKRKSLWNINTRKDLSAVLQDESQALH